MGTRWREHAGYMLRENVTRGFPMPPDPNPRRPVASGDRYEALRAVSDDVLMELRPGGRRLRQRSYPSELLDIANGTGRRLSAICAFRYEDLRLREGLMEPLRSHSSRRECDFDPASWRLACKLEKSRPGRLPGRRLPGSASMNSSENLRSDS